MQTQETLKQVNTTTFASAPLEPAAYATFSVTHFKSELATLKAQLVACVVDSAAIDKGVQQLLADNKAALDDQVAELKRNVAEATAWAQELNATHPKYQTWTDQVAEIEDIAAYLVGYVESELQPGAPSFERKKVEMFAEAKRRAMDLKSAMPTAWEQIEADLDDEGSEIGRKIRCYSTAKEPSDKEKANQELVTALGGAFKAIFRMAQREMKLLGVTTPWLRVEGGAEQQAKVAEQELEEKVVAIMTAKL